MLAALLMLVSALSCRAWYTRPAASAPVGRGAISGARASRFGEGVSLFVGSKGLSIGTPVPEGSPTATAVPNAPGAVTVMRVPILMYHYIRLYRDPRDRLGQDLSVTPENFIKQVEWLTSHGFHSVTLRTVVESWKKGRPLPEKAVVLTFDDGYEDVYTAAFPVLKARGLVGVVFAVSGFVGRSGYATAQQLGILQQEGWEIGAHTVHHLDLTGLDPFSLQHEVGGSAADLTELLGQRPVSFAYPSGRWNRTVEGAVAAAGFEAAVTTQWGIAIKGQDILALPRLRVRGSTSIQAFEAILTPATH